MASPDGARRYEIDAVRYGTLRSRKAELFYRHGSYGEPDVEIDMAYYFWLLRDGDETIVVDCGFDPDVGARRGRTCLCPPLDALRALGVEPESVSTVVVTHLHYDHIGNLPAFPAATLIVPRTELDFWTGPIASRFQFASHVEQREIDFVAKAVADGRVRLTDGTEEILDGVTAIAVGGHSAGQQVTVVRGASRRRRPRLGRRALLRGARARAAVRRHARPRADVRRLRGSEGARARGCGGGPGARPRRRSALSAGRYGWSRLGGADRMKGRATP